MSFMPWACKYGAMVRWPVVVMCALLVTGCAASKEATDTRCGWDLTTAEGLAANQERLNFVSSFLADNPGQTPPPIDSPYWFGDCPLPTDAPTAAPDHENESPHDHDEGVHLEEDPAAHE